MASKFWILQWLNLALGLGLLRGFEISNQGKILFSTCLVHVWFIFPINSTSGCHLILFLRVPGVAVLNFRESRA